MTTKQGKQFWFMWHTAMVFCALVFLLSVMSNIAWTKNVSAFGGKCWVRGEGGYSQECLDRNKKRTIKMTYATELPSYFRRSRAGSNWRNHTTKERVAAKRKKTRSQKSAILQRSRRKYLSLRHTAFQNLKWGQTTSSASALYRRALKRREMYKSFSRLYQ